MTDALLVALGHALAWVAVALVARNAFQLWLRHLADQRAIERSRRGVDGLQVVQHVPRGTPDRTNGERSMAPIVIPDDLEAHVMQWDDSWARDDERASVRATFLQLYTGDVAATWQKVRRSIGIGELP